MGNNRCNFRWYHSDDPIGSTVGKWVTTQDTWETISRHCRTSVATSLVEKWVPSISLTSCDPSKKRTNNFGEITGSNCPVHQTPSSGYPSTWSNYANHVPSANDTHTAANAPNEPPGTTEPSVAQLHNTESCVARWCRRPDSAPPALRLGVQQWQSIDKRLKKNKLIDHVDYLSNPSLANEQRFISCPLLHIKNLCLRPLNNQQLTLDQPYKMVIVNGWL